jgi:hypothetical protein
MRSILVFAFGIVAVFVLGSCSAIDDAKQKASSAARGRLADECRKHARDISDSDDRRNALQACRYVRDGNTKSARRELSAKCAQEAQQIDDAEARREAKRRCRSIRKQ